MSYLLGVDCGSSVCKAALFDEHGALIGLATRPLALLQPQPGHAERDMLTLWEQASGSIRDVLTQANISAASIAAVGCTGHGNGLYLLDRSGQALGAAVQSLDQRAQAVLNAWHADGTVARAYPYIRQQMYAAQVAPLLAWVKRHAPDRYHQISAVLCCKDYINYRLTGEVLTDLSDSSCSGLLDVTTKRYSSDLLAAYGLDDLRDCLPTPVRSTEVIGRVSAHAAAETGLQAGTPVIAGMIDIVAAAIGTGGITPDLGCVVAGSWSINQLVSDALPQAALFLASIFADGERWLLVEGSATSTANLTWFVDGFCPLEQAEAAARGLSVYDVCAEKAAALAPAIDDPLFHPFLYSNNVGASARGGFHDISGWHGRDHLLRAVFEGVAFAHRTHIERLRAAGYGFRQARLTGGAARSPFWAQMFADVLQAELTLVTSSETGTHGAALAAGVGVGLYPNLESAIASAVQRGATYAPNPRFVDHYSARYHRYLSLAQHNPIGETTDDH